MAGGLLMAFLLFQIPVVNADELRVAVASNFLFPLKELSREFEKSTGNEVVVISGSTGKLYAQIHQGAPFDIFLAADSTRPELLEKEGMGVSGSRFTYAVGRLALWSADTKKFLMMGLKVLDQKNFRYLAMANPKTAPYGKATEQVLKEKGYWEKIQSRLVRGENISQTLQFVVTGNAEIGFISLSQLSRSKRPLGGTSWVVPSNLHDPIRQDALLLKRAETNNVARNFLSFLKSKQGRKIIESYGYSLEHF
ncbi:MAG: molybdate ABC transporter substrate-binding protein [Nitrospinae bacterium]|nr:molybdate ABC transporter substrate-binding protein [Nitrospinota bacterium]